MVSVPPQCTDHRLAGRPLALWWWTDVYEFILWSARSPQPPVHQPMGGTTTIHPPYGNPPFLWWARIPDDGKPLTPSSSLVSPFNSCSYIEATSVPPLYIASHRPAPFLPFLSGPLILFPSVAKSSAGCDTRPPNHDYYCDLILQCRL